MHGVVAAGVVAAGVVAAGGDAVLADGLTYLFGRASCSICGSTFTIADWLEAENSPGQPIDPILPRTPDS